MQKIIVASKNPVKLNAARMGFEKMFPGESFEFDSIGVPSGVSDQPMDDEETYRGALQRAKNAQKALPDADYWVGLEGGIQPQFDGMMAFAWIVVLSAEQQGQARTSAFFLPPKVVALIQSGMELGEADDVVFGHSNSKQKGGAVGLLTDNVMDRAGLYAESVVFALIPFRNKALYT